MAALNTINLVGNSLAVTFLQRHEGRHAGQLPHRPRRLGDRGRRLDAPAVLRVRPSHDRRLAAAQRGVHAAHHDLRPGRARPRARAAQRARFPARDRARRQLGDGRRHAAAPRSRARGRRPAGARPERAARCGSSCASASASSRSTSARRWPPRSRCGRRSSADGRSRCSSTAPIPRTRSSCRSSGRPTPFLRSPALLARFCGCRSFPGFFLRNPDGSYFNVWGEPARGGPVALTGRGCGAGHDAGRCGPGGSHPRHPAQWFNFYRFWGEAPPSPNPLPLTGGEGTLSSLSRRERAGVRAAPISHKRSSRSTARRSASGSFASFARKLLRLLARPDLPERLLAHVADEVVREVAAESHLAVRLDLREVPGDRAQADARTSRRSWRSTPGTLLGRHVRDERGPGRPSAESRNRRRFKPFRSLTSSSICCSFVAATALQSNSKPFQEVAAMPKSSRMTRSYSAPTSDGVNQRRPDVDRVERQLAQRLDGRRDHVRCSARSRAGSRSASAARASAPCASARPRGCPRPRPSAKLSSRPRMRLCTSGRPVDRDRDRVDADLDELARERLEPPAVGDDGAGQPARLDLADRAGGCPGRGTARRRRG